jgi:hypothetical protein
MDMEHITLYNLCLSEERSKILLSRYAYRVRTAIVCIILLLYLVIAYKTVLLTKADVASLQYSKFILQNTLM